MGSERQYLRDAVASTPVLQGGAAGLVVSGELSRGSYQAIYNRSIEDPTAFTASGIATALQAWGIDVRGKVRRGLATSSNVVSQRSHRPLPAGHQSDETGPSRAATVWPATYPGQCARQ